jgi:hypothetical protein
MEYATHIIAWLAMLVYIASSGFDLWEKYQRLQRVRKLEEESGHIFFGDGLE